MTKIEENRDGNEERNHSQFFYPDDCYGYSVFCDRLGEGSASKGAYVLSMKSGNTQQQVRIDMREPIPLPDIFTRFANGIKSRTLSAISYGNGLIIESNDPLELSVEFEIKTPGIGLDHFSICRGIPLSFAGVQARSWPEYIFSIWSRGVSFYVEPTPPFRYFDDLLDIYGAENRPEPPKRIPQSDGGY